MQKRGEMLAGRFWRPSAAEGSGPEADQPLPSRRRHAPVVALGAGVLRPCFDPDLHLGALLQLDLLTIFVFQGVLNTDLLISR